MLDGHFISGKDLQFAGLSLNEILSTDQLGGLPQNICCKAPDLRIGKRVKKNE